MVDYSFSSSDMPGAGNFIWKLETDPSFVLKFSLNQPIVNKYKKTFWMPSAFVTCHIGAWGRVWIELRINRKIMPKKQAKTSTPFISRRTGIDRRWITSIGHQPERRSGKDRRSTQHRSFLAPIESNDQNTKQTLFGDAPFNAISPEANASDGVDSEKYLSRHPEILAVDDAPDDRPGNG